MTGFSYPVQQDEWFETIAIGALLMVFSFAIFPVVLIAGYQWRVASHAHRNTPPPAFDNWGRLLTEGGRALAAVFLLTAAVIATVFIPWLTLRYLAFGHTPLEFGTTSALMTWGLGAFAAALLAIYLTPAGFVAATRTNKARNACSPTILIHTLNPKYFFLWTIVLTSGAGLLVTSVLLNFVPVVGTILGAATTFYTTSAMTAVFSFGLK